MIPSRTTREFRENFALLPEDIRRLAQRACRLFRTEPHHPGLRFKKVDEESNVYSVRIGLGYRALGVMEGSTVVWFWISSPPNATACWGDHLMLDSLLALTSRSGNRRPPLRPPPGCET